MALLIVYLVIAIGVSFLCSILEAVLLSITPSYVEQISRTHPKRGARLRKVKDNLDQSISCILILNTFAHTMGAAGVGAEASRVFGSQWEGVIAVVLTLAILYFSEIIPKTLGTTFWRALAPSSAAAILLLTKFTFPLVWLSTRLTQLISRKKKNTISREEILAFAALGYKGGALGTLENEMMENILKLRESTVKDILTPRTVVHAIEQSTCIDDALAMDASHQFTRIPVYDDQIDKVTGLVNSRDMLQAKIDELGQNAVSSLSKPVSRVSGSLPVLKLIDTFIKRREHLFLVEDSYGQTEGIVTLEDALETVLGREIVDESDTVEDMQALAKTRFRQRLKSNDRLQDWRESEE